jgi:long-chain fatty acid transport protein
MNTRLTLALLVIALIGGPPSPLNAGGVRIASQDGFATARGEAFVATADNPAAIYYNPAGITQIEGTAVRSSLYGIYLNPNFSPEPGQPNSGNTYHLENKLAAAPSLFCAVTPEASPLSFGLGLYAPYGGNVNWPDDTGFRAVTTESTLQYLTINPVIALKPVASFAIAAGAMVNYVNLESAQGLRRFQGIQNDYFRFTGDGWSASYNLGVLWKPQAWVALGATIRGAAQVTLEGQTEFARPVQIPATTLDAQADYKFPFTAVVGISVRPTPKWNLEFNADYTDWSSFDSTVIHQATPPGGWPNYLGQWPQDISVLMDWQPSWMYEFGLTHYFDNDWHVSAGYVYSQNSVPDTYYLPATLDLDRHFISAGIGCKGPHLDFDIAYQFGYGPRRTVDGSRLPTNLVPAADQVADGTYEYISHAVMLTVGLHF